MTRQFFNVHIYGVRLAKLVNTVDTDIEDDRATELEVVERESDGVVLARH
jgi:hypothetical protein